MTHGLRFAWLYAGSCLMMGSCIIKTMRRMGQEIEYCWYYLGRARLTCRKVNGEEQQLT